MISFERVGRVLMSLQFHHQPDERTDCNASWDTDTRSSQKWALYSCEVAPLDKSNQGQVEADSGTFTERIILWHHERVKLERDNPKTQKSRLEAEGTKPRQRETEQEKQVAEHQSQANPDMRGRIGL
ncbi:hypothetical protein EYF80_007040 [Liparis tanakae]|uniref:Uncharacterized protein n=1 Tax=Liparis tanakae TaxID=230148 RepID=A0A4Z2IXS9_9TELE|nr:hypothetical protein EYF80_007040 [Liparis tanakae]